MTGKMLNKIRRRLAKTPKSNLAYRLGLVSTSTIDNWTKRGVVPVKYHAKIEEVFNEFFK
jgi:hypothetical protein